MKSIAMLFILMASALFADDITTGKLEFPKGIKSEVGKVFKVETLTKVEAIGFQSKDPSLVLIPECDEDKGTLSARFLGMKPGKYKIDVAAYLGNKLFRWGSLQVDIVEPAPVLPSVEPDEALLVLLQVAFTADKNPEKESLKINLMKIYMLCAEACNDEKVKTIEQLLSALVDSTNTLLKGRENLRTCRDILGRYLNEKLPTVATFELSKKDRDESKSVFVRIAKTLEQVK